MKIAEDVDLRISVAGKESNRQWDSLEKQLVSKGISVRLAWGLTLTRKISDAEGVQDLRYTHISPGYFWNLLTDHPDAIITNELGIRTVIAIIYSKITGCPVWVWWGGTLHTERNRSKFKQLFRNILISQISHWISYGKTSTDYLLSIKVSRDQILQIQNSVDEQLYTQVNHLPTKTTDMPRLLYVGQMIGRKGVKALLKSASRLQNTGYIFSLTLVGGGPQLTELKSLAHTLKLENVYFLPPQTVEQMPNIYHNADVLIFPTLEDVWGLVVNESLWSGVPVLSSIYAGCTSEIVPEKNRFDPQNETDIDNAIQRAIMGKLSPADTNPLLTTSQVANMIVNDIKRELRS
ncbi:glycosyltransferase family 4 protein [Deinococcus ruber]|nr:glycosyltransferase [Deinococcus ruber]